MWVPGDLRVWIDRVHDVFVRPVVISEGALDLPFARDEEPKWVILIIEPYEGLELLIVLAALP